MTAEANNPDRADKDLEKSQLEAVDRALAGQQRKDSDDENLHQLTLAMKAERPAMREEFKEELDQRVAADFKRNRFNGLKKRFTNLLQGRRVLVPVVGVAFSALLAGVIVTSLTDEESSKPVSQELAGNPSADTPEEQNFPAGEESEGRTRGREKGSKESTDDFLDEEGEEAPAAGIVAPTPTEPSQPLTDSDDRADGVKNRKVERSASLELTTDSEQVSDTSNKVIQITDKAGGYVEESDLSSADGNSSAYLTLRVPSDKLASVLAEISKLADVTSRAQSSDDITGEYKSASDSLESLRAQRKSLLRRLEKADTDVQAESLRIQLRNIKSQISQAESRRRSVKNRDSFATVDVSIQTAGSEVTASEDDDSWSIGDALTDAGDFLKTVLGVGILVLAAAVPIVAILLLVKVVLAVRRRRKSTERNSSTEEDK